MKVQTKNMQNQAIKFQLCQEVTSEVFEERFYGRYQQVMSSSLRKKLSPAFVWGEIMSVIKGGIDFGFYYPYLTCEQYLRSGSKILTGQQKRTVYYMFLKYESWKNSIGAFDFLDVINHIFETHHTKKWDNFGSRFNKIMNNKIFDYLVIDEVQDLYPKTIALLSLITENRVIFAGDTAQTIAKGVNYRISDLRSKLRSS